MADVSIDYTSRDFAGIKTSLLDYADRYFPEWTSRSEGDFGMLLVELFSYMGDIQSYYTDRAMQESYLSTATQRLSVIQIAGLLGYTPHEPVPAVGTVRLVTDADGPAVIVPAGTQVVTDIVAQLDAPLVYETDVAVTVPADGDPDTNYATVAVTHGQTRSGVGIGTSNGQAAQEYRLPHLSVISGSVHVFVETPAGEVEWTYFDHLIDATPEDAAFTLRTDSQGAMWVVFGDGVNGIPPQQSLSITATYRTGGGIIGNVPSGTVNALAAADLTGVAIARTGSGVPQTSAMTGGADAESTESIRQNAPLVYRTQQRAVTPGDFEALALAVPGVTKSKAVVQHSTSATIFITGPGGGTPTEELKDRVVDFLTDRSLSGTTVSVAGPDVIPVNFGSGGDPLKLVVLPNYSRAAVDTAVRRVIAQILSVDNIDLNMTLPVSSIYDAVQEVPGVAYWWLSFMARSDSAQVQNTWITFREYEIPTIGTINMTSSGGIG